MSEKTCGQCKHHVGDGWRYGVCRAYQYFFDIIQPHIDENIGAKFYITEDRSGCPAFAPKEECNETQG